MSGRHTKPKQFPAGTCAVCTFPVDVAEATIVRPGELPFGPPLHQECYEADLIYIAPNPANEGLIGLP